MQAVFQPFKIKRSINIISTFKTHLTLFQPYFNVEGRSCAGWEGTYCSLEFMFTYAILTPSEICSRVQPLHFTFWQIDQQNPLNYIYLYIFFFYYYSFWKKNNHCSDSLHIFSIYIPKYTFLQYFIQFYITDRPTCYIKT